MNKKVKNHITSHEVSTRQCKNSSQGNTTLDKIWLKNEERNAASLEIKFNSWTPSYDTHFFHESKKYFLHRGHTVLSAYSVYLHEW